MKKIYLVEALFYDTCIEMPESMKEHESSCGEWTERTENIFKIIFATSNLKSFSSWGCDVLIFLENGLRLFEIFSEWIYFLVIFTDYCKEPQTWTSRFGSQVEIFKEIFRDWNDSWSVFSWKNSEYFIRVIKY